MEEMKKHVRGFTLIELLIVIGVIAVLATVVIVALDPVRRFQDARDARRRNDIDQIITAAKTHQVDNGGAYLASITAMTAGSAYQIGTNAAGCNAGCTAQVTQAACVDITGFVTAGYLGSVPFDPSSGVATATDYYMIRNANGTLTVGACDPERATSISAVR